MPEFPLNMYVFSEKHVRLFPKTRTCFPALVRLKIQIYYRNFAVEL